MAFLDFDATQVEPTKGFVPAPKGDYKAIIVESDITRNRKNTGNVLKLLFEIIEGQYTGRKIYLNINIEHENATTQAIGQGELSLLTRTLGLGRIQDTMELHGKPLTIAVKVSLDQQGEERNEINPSKFKPAGAAVSPTSSPASAPTPPPVAQPAPAPTYAAPATPAPEVQATPQPAPAPGGYEPPPWNPMG